jgi:uncharacterized protein
MEPAAILDVLMHSEELPRDALRAASERRAEMVPLFIDEIERHTQAGSTKHTTDAPLFFLFHLLGEWKETSAYRALARLLSCPGRVVDAAIADGITESVHRVVAAVFDGDPGPIYNIVLDQRADEFVRARMCEALAMLVVQRRLDRGQVASFLRDCWVNLQPRDDCFVWHGWQSAIAMLGLTELKDVVREAFDREVIHPRWLCYRDFAKDLERAISNPTEPWPHGDESFMPFGDTIEELSGWYAFSEEAGRRKTARREGTSTDLESIWSHEPVRNPMRGVGRNDPCPCGSGRKYKKCCLN